MLKLTDYLSMYNFNPHMQSCSLLLRDDRGDISKCKHCLAKIGRACELLTLGAGAGGLIGTNLFLQGSVTVGTFALSAGALAVAIIVSAVVAECIYRYLKNNAYVPPPYIDLAELAKQAALQAAMQTAQGKLKELQTLFETYEPGKAQMLQELNTIIPELGIDAIIVRQADEGLPAAYELIGEIQKLELSAQDKKSVMADLDAMIVKNIGMFEDTIKIKYVSLLSSSDEQVKYLRMWHASYALLNNWKELFGLIEIIALSAPSLSHISLGYLGLALSSLCRLQSEVGASDKKQAKIVSGMLNQAYGASEHIFKVMCVLPINSKRTKKDHPSVLAVKLREHGYLASSKYEISDEEMGMITKVFKDHYLKSHDDVAQFIENMESTETWSAFLKDFLTHFPPKCAEPVPGVWTVYHEKLPGGDPALEPQAEPICFEAG